jgi:hypothetical protein
VRVVFADHITDDARRFDMARALVQPHSVHGVKNAALHRLLAIGSRGQGAAGDDAHRVFEVAAGSVVGGRRNVAGRAAGGRRQIRRRGAASVGNE